MWAMILGYIIPAASPSTGCRAWRPATWTGSHRGPAGWAGRLLALVLPRRLPSPSSSRRWSRSTVPAQAGPHRDIRTRRSPATCSYQPEFQFVAEGKPTGPRGGRRTRGPVPRAAQRVQRRGRPPQVELDSRVGELRPSQDRLREERPGARGEGEENPRGAAHCGSASRVQIVARWHPCSGAARSRKERPRRGNRAPAEPPSADGMCRGQPGDEFAVQGVNERALSCEVVHRPAMREYSCRTAGSTRVRLWWLARRPVPVTPSVQNRRRRSCDLHTKVPTAAQLFTH